ncbi:MAG TPA: carboxypeptidase regulatory-like domain-containing protein [Longimicrobiaceae bacterium]|nr:carboxypeptidase regulatory-like domain-containing protein [Longimicrobiaceae bacterium]
MRKLSRSAALLAFFAAAPLAAQQAGGVLDVSVVEDSTGHPLAGVRVQLAAQNLAVVTGSDGSAVLRGVQPGPQLLQVNRMGYAPVSAPLQVSAGDSLPLEIALQPASVQLAGVTARVQVRRALQSAGFYTRQKRGLGVFITPEEMQYNEMRPLHLTVGTLPGVQIVALSEGGVNHYYVASSRSIASTLGGICLMRTYLNGVPLSDPEIDDIAPQNISAMEVFRGPSEIPAEYNGTGSACGVVLLWTKDR